MTTRDRRGFDAQQAAPNAPSILRHQAKFAEMEDEIRYQLDMLKFKAWGANSLLKEREDHGADQGLMAVSYLLDDIADQASRLLEQIDDEQLAVSPPTGGKAS